MHEWLQKSKNKAMKVGQFQPQTKQAIDKDNMFKLGRGPIAQWQS